jgi:hypothetical protein
MMPGGSPEVFVEFLSGVDVGQHVLCVDFNVIDFGSVAIDHGFESLRVLVYFRDFRKECSV